MTRLVEETYQWFQKAVPNPNATNVRVQLGVHLEEVEELLREVYTNDPTTMYYLDEVRKGLFKLNKYLKDVDVSLNFPNRVDTLDAICDQLVTGIGFAYMLGLDPIGGLGEVNKSNWSKFVDGEPLFDANRKIKKGRDYQKPDLRPFT